jgi:polyhydroxybutyrate depolymerase
MRRFEVLFTSIALIALAGCTSATDTGNADGALVASTEAVVSTTTAEPSPVAEPSVASAVPQGFNSITTVDGRVRSYRVVDLSNGEPAPLLFVLHGFGGTAAMMSEASEIDRSFADRYDLRPIVVYPNGTGAESGLPQSWNAGGCCPFSTFDFVDDVAFFDQLIDALTMEYDIDPERVWVVGHSNGGMMAYRLACELSTRITAIGVAAGAMMIDSCSPTQPVSALHVHGELDTVVPLLGGDIAGIVFPSAQQSVDVFTRNGNGVAELVTNPAWTHDWQSDWTALFAEFLAAQ